MTVIANDYLAFVWMESNFHRVCIGIICILDQLGESDGWFANKPFTQLLKQFGINGEVQFRHNGRAFSRVLATANRGVGRYVGEYFWQSCALDLLALHCRSSE